MRTTNRAIHAFAVAMLLLAGLLATMAPVTAQPDEDEPDEGPPAVTATQDDADPGDIDQDAAPDTESGVGDDVTDEDTAGPDDGIDRNAAGGDPTDEADPAGQDAGETNDAEADPLVCDDGDWRILTTDDGTGFASEDHCEDHVAEYGASSVDEPGGAVDDEYVIVTVTEPSGGGGGRCRGTITLVNGQPGQVVSAIIQLSNNKGTFEPVFLPDAGQTSRTVMIDEGTSLPSGSAQFLDPSTWQPTGEQLPVFLPSTGCRAAGDRTSDGATRVIATISDPNDAGKCRLTVTLVNGQNGQVVQAVIQSIGAYAFAPIFLPSTGETSRTMLVNEGTSLLRGSAQFLDPTTWEETGEMIPVSFDNTKC